MSDTTIFLLLFIFFQSNGQNKLLGKVGAIEIKREIITPMHTFFQKYADSTVIIEYPTNSYAPLVYKIVTNTGDTVNAFEYNAIQKLETAIMPTRLRSHMLMEKYKYFGGAASVNPYFNLVNLPVDTLKVIWNKIDSLRLWTLTVDNEVPKCRNIPFSPHPDQIIIHLITKKEIKTLSFSNALLFEEYCPGNMNRRPVVELYNFFSRYIPSD